ncbi:S9 family peptidase [uncultured Sphingomonas sp.]|uniref:alpha/beta hydrolase family protein n=1 Tax=uncultured Sphingomonas sp. TaxID=158754 RepID=UPI002635ABD1|nr:S9 family peptidase [uncultured Sphingomonas sp.]
MWGKTAALLAGVSAIAGVARGAETDPAAAFGAREYVQSASLSPDGTQLAYVAPTKGQGSALYVVSTTEADAKPRYVVAASGDPDRMIGCDWVSDVRLFCNVSITQQTGAGLTTITRMIAINADQSNMKIVSRRSGDGALYLSYNGGAVIDMLPGEKNKVLVTAEFVPEARAGTLTGQRGAGLGVERLDTDTLARERVVAPRREAVEYISDGNGQVRVMGLLRSTDIGRATGELSYYYRAKGDLAWKPLNDYDIKKREGFNPLAVDPAGDIVYGYDKLDGRQALFSRPLAEHSTAKLVYARPDVDIDGLIRIGRRQRVVGATFATDKRTAVYFDAEIERMRASLTKALPGAPIINVQDASLDEQKLLLWAGSDTDPGRYYLFDRTKRQLRPLLLSRPQLADVKLATVKAVQVRASDGTMVPAYLTLPPGSGGRNLPAIVMPHGGPSARDEWGFDWLSQYYASRGYAVLQPNYRGSSGYGDAWYQKNGFRSWRTAIGDVVDAGRWMVAQGIADPAKLGIVGWSYGGYAALQSNVLAPDLFKAVVAIAPVADLPALIEEARLYTNYDLVRDFVGTGPHLREGSPAQHADAFKAPVLLFHGTYDQNVSVEQSRLMDRRLAASGKRHELVTYHGLAHALTDSVARADMLKRSDMFLRSAFGS